MIFSLPSSTGRDIVSEIERKKQAAAARKARALRDKCRGSNSCDCPRCHGR